MPSIPHDAVTMIRGDDDSIFWARDGAEKPPKTTVWMAPSLQVARRAMMA